MTNNKITDNSKGKSFDLLSFLKHSVNKQHLLPCKNNHEYTDKSVYSSLHNQTKVNKVFCANNSLKRLGILCFAVIASTLCLTTSSILKKRFHTKSFNNKQIAEPSQVSSNTVLAFSFDDSMYSDVSLIIPQSCVSYHEAINTYKILSELNTVLNDIIKDSEISIRNYLVALLLSRHIQDEIIEADDNVEKTLKAFWRSVPPFNR